MLTAVVLTLLAVGSVATVAGSAQRAWAADAPAAPDAAPKIEVTKSVKTINGGVPAIGQNLHVGDKVVWSYNVHNAGNVALSNLRLTDVITSAGNRGSAVAIDTTSCNLDRSLAVNRHRICSSQPYTVTQADVDAKRVAGRATASGTPPAGADVTARSTTNTPAEVPAGPKIEVAKSVKSINGAAPTAGQKLHVGDKIVWSYHVHNAGDVQLANVRLTDAITSAGNPGATIAIDPASCTLGSTLAANAHLVCSSQPYTVTQADVDAGGVADKATVTGTPPEPNDDVTATATTDTPAGRSGQPVRPNPRIPTTVDAGYAGSPQRGSVTLEILGALLLAFAFGGLTVGRRRRREG